MQLRFPSMHYIMQMLSNRLVDSDRSCDLLSSCDTESTTLRQSGALFSEVDLLRPAPGPANYHRWQMRITNKQGGSV